MLKRPVVPSGIGKSRMSGVNLDSGENSCGALFSAAINPLVFSDKVLYFSGIMILLKLLFLASDSGMSFQKLSWAKIAGDTNNKQNSKTDWVKFFI